MSRAALMIGAILLLFSSFVASAQPTKIPPTQPSPLASYLPPRTLMIGDQLTRLSLCSFPEDIAPAGICVFEDSNGCVYAFLQVNAEAKWSPIEKRCPAPKTKGTLL